ncbi:MAG: PH domain-containing protein [Phycisphaeraceae bacterium]|nr:PH domain-containing protein [Phycisphaeraceae bacterium]
MSGVQAPLPSSPTAALERGVWGILVRLFRVPDDPPGLPPDSGTQRTMRPAPGYLRWQRIQLAMLFGPLVVLLLAGGAVAAIASLTAGAWWTWLIVVAAVPPVALLALVSWVAVHLRYRATWYVIGGSAVRLRRGIWIIRETTITLENVQNCSVRQGPLQRICGISDLVLETAGSAAPAPGKNPLTLNEARFEGLTDASALRDELMRAVRASRSAGLGDDDAVDVVDAGRRARPSSAGVDHLALDSIRLGPAHRAVLEDIRAAARALAARGR